MKSVNNKVPIQETHTLPSNGLLYKDSNIPAEVTIRAMNALDEKRRLSSTGVSVIPTLLESCVIDPENIDIMSLKLFDLNFLMYKLRIITYGAEYKLNIECPHCGHKSEVIINLDDLPVNMLDDSFVEPFKLDPLPVSGDVIECKMLSIQDYINMENEAKRILSKTPSYVGDPEFILSYKYKIVSVNGEEVPSYKIQKYIEELHARDMRFFDSKYNDLVNNIGLDLSHVEGCSHCGEDINFILPVTDEFFRPTY